MTNNDLNENIKSTCIENHTLDEGSNTNDISSVTSSQNENSDDDVENLTMHEVFDRMRGLHEN
ncbi:MAG: hypothetical protein LBF68_01030, partial [Christensenellaceae bacterium]|nr:hypothetical protein [Christensenellaceae bacterium]